MTYESLIAGIQRLILARAKAHGDDKKQAYINKKLDKLYELKRIMLIQMSEKRNKKEGRI